MRPHIEFDRQGNVRLSMLLKRVDGLGDTLEVRIGRHQAHLETHSDDWFELVSDADLPTALAEGLSIRTEHHNVGRVEWSLSAGRKFYVFALQEGVAQFVSTTRLALGRRQLVLAESAVATEVQAVLSEACASEVTSNAEIGNWQLFGPVTPTRSIEAVPGEDLLNLLRPLADIEILLEGGLPISRSEWLDGFPPEIRISGELGSEAVLIDNAVSVRASDGRITAPNYADIGPHIIWCARQSAAYSIVSPPTQWEEWDAYPNSRGLICGAIARPRPSAQQTIVSVATSHPLLLGAEPGQVFVCSRRPGATWLGPVPFDPVWALPLDPLHADRRSASIKVVHAQPIRVIGRDDKRRKPNKWNIAQWIHAILDSSKKKLPIEQTNASLWANYVAHAKHLARKERQGLGTK